jgi:hypothetical protein
MHQEKRATWFLCLFPLALCSFLCAKAKAPGGKKTKPNLIRARLKLEFVHGSWAHVYANNKELSKAKARIIRSKCLFFFYNATTSVSEQQGLGRV